MISGANTTPRNSKTRPCDAFRVVAKPAGALCNLECDYCYFLKKADLYPGSSFRMSDEVMEKYIRQTIEGQRGPAVTIAWQGGEPTLMGLEFFRRAMAVQQKYLRPGMAVENALQTNGVLLDEDWCAFLRENNFLVSLGLDGPRELHDAYRHDKAGGSVFDQVVGAARMMRKQGVAFNVLCAVNAVNSRRPLEVYRFFRDELGTRHIQFIPLVERDNDSGYQEGTRLTDRSVQPEQYGRFLVEVFDEWLRRDVGEMVVQPFDGVLASRLRGYSTLCIFRPSCGDSAALEHNGDLYSCDYFVEPGYYLGNIREKPVAELVGSAKQQAFGRAKSETLPRYCRECEYLFACFGECPKNRVLTTSDGEPGLNWLCAGLKTFFRHTERPMKTMADLLRRGRTPSEVTATVEAEEREKFVGVGRNDPAPTA